MLLEDDAVDAVAEFITEHGWTIESIAHATEHGDDIVATKGNEVLRVEAKGSGSSRGHSARFGKTFTSGQVHTHVAVAVLRAMTWVSQSQSTRAAMALPDDQAHRSRIERVDASLRRLHIGVFWVTEGRAVSVDAPWRLD
ncbi:hypothetical protein GCM10011575_31200 [Microlunatus endophyticus]|uniref:Protein NO VEIN C-terminal domain-containing protein n=1 Tax=Microlunatus endophyticus TaxID=1716077 RepID=A0A917SDZ1_9ACTN|nr:hypothetical protein [Microlunatus endophyticus]GGL70493.1 hypothetical protein GCM10011575_31200 [Microlunatus endophyticus]